MNTILAAIAGSFVLAAILATHTHHNPKVNVETLPGIVGRFLFARFLDGRRSIRELDARMAIALPAERDELTEEPERDEDENGCNVPCLARHCIEHAGIVGTVAQRRHSRAAEQRVAIAAWTTPTAEWDFTALGLKPLSIEDFALPKRTPGKELADLEAQWYAQLEAECVAAGIVLRSARPGYVDVTDDLYAQVT